MNQSAIKAKPFLKWAGGKRQLLKKFNEGIKGIREEKIEIINNISYGL